MEIGVEITPSLFFNLASKSSVFAQLVMDDNEVFMSKNL